MPDDDDRERVEVEERPLPCLWQIRDLPTTVRRFREMTIIFLAYKLPDPISDELARQGHSVYECLAISEVFALVEEHFDAQIVIAQSWKRNGRQSSSSVTQPCT